MKLLVPLDMSELAEQALPAAVAIANAQGASEIRLVLVHEPIRYAGYPDAPWNMARSATEFRYLEDKARELRSLVTIPVSVDHPTGAAVQTMTEMAASTGIDLIVMTTHGRTGLSRAWLGSVADGVMRSTGIPVLMLRPIETPAAIEGAAKPFSRVLIPLDGSHAAESIIDAAISVAGRSAKYFLARVVQPIPLIVPTADPYTMTTMMTDPGATELVADEARKYIRDVAGRIAEHGVTAIEQSVLIGDHPAQILLDVAKAHDIDLIALATHGRGMSRLVLGSVADKLLRGSTTPLLVSRRESPTSA
jgi:nucleotide-binding universal stress UspA family protein